MKAVRHGNGVELGAGDHILTYINPLLLPKTHRPLTLSLIHTTFQDLTYRKRIIAKSFRPTSSSRTAESDPPPTVKMWLCHDTDTAAPSPTNTIDDNARMTGGSYVPEKDSVFFITPPDHVRFPAYVPAGIEISYNEKPSFVEVPDCSSPWEAYCPNHDDLVSFRQEAISNNILTRPFTFRVHYGPNDSDTYDQLPAGTRFQKALQRCPSCVSTAPDGTTRRVSSERVDGPCQADVGSAAGLESPNTSNLPTATRINATVFPSSEFITPEGEDYRCASSGDITGLGPPTGRGYFLVNPANGEIKVYEQWTTGPDRLANHGETAADGVPGRGQAFFMPFGHYHQRAVAAETPRVAAHRHYPDHTIRTADQTYISDMPIPNRVARGLRATHDQNTMKHNESSSSQTE
jgi:hypothetical protein